MYLLRHDADLPPFFIILILKNTFKHADTTSMTLPVCSTSREAVVKLEIEKNQSCAQLTLTQSELSAIKTEDKLENMILLQRLLASQGKLYIVHHLPSFFIAKMRFQNF